jgi:hypothetical protein
MTTTDNTAPWVMLQTELINFLGGTGDPTQFSGLQMVLTPFYALWDNPIWGLWQGFEIADTIPAWGPVYKPSSDHRVTNAYFLFLNSIDAPAQDKDASNQVKQLREPMSTSLDNIQKVRKQLVTEWKNFNVSQPGQQQFNQWFTQNWEQKLNEVEGNYERIATQWIVAANKAGGGYPLLAAALSDYDNPTFQIQATDNFGAILPYRTWSLQPRLADFIALAQAEQGTMLTLQITANTSTTTLIQSGFNVGFLGIGSGDASQRVAIDTRAQDFLISFSAKSFSGIQVSPGPWFHQDVVLRFKNGPFTTNTSFFGSEGVFNLMINTLYVAYQPSIIATLDAAAYTTMKEGWNTGQDVSIGPFLFSSGPESADNVNFNDQTRTVTLISNSPHPQLVAVDCNIMPNS